MRLRPKARKSLLLAVFVLLSSVVGSLAFFDSSSAQSGRATLAGQAASGGTSAGQAAAADTSPDSQTRTPIKHVVMLMQENHSFDNYFGTYPGADGLPKGTCMPVDPSNPANKDCVQPFHITKKKDQAGPADPVENDPDAVQVVDLDHSDPTFQAQLNNGLMNGFVAALNARNQNGRIAMGYYDDRDLPWYWNIADKYVLFDSFFSSAAAGSFLNHVYWLFAAAVVPGDGVPSAAIDPRYPTIFDRLEEQGISWKLYVQNYDANLTYRTARQYPGNRASQVVWAPVLAVDRYIDDPKLNSKIVDLSQYYIDLENGTLPAVAFIVPSGASEHPPGNLQSGQRSVVSLINALIRSSAWDSSAFMLTYDDWGGWYDHVLPPRVDQAGYGFRVPALLVSPYARKGYIEHSVLDYTSVLKFIEENWDLRPLAARDSLANSIAPAFDFESPPRPPEFLTDQRGVTTTTTVKIPIIYGVYGSALGLAVGLIFLSGRVRPSRRAKVDPNPEAEDR